MTNEDEDLRRLRWRCRRGMRELDELLLGFLDEDFVRASAGQRQAFVRLLTRPDPEILALLIGQASDDDPGVDDIIQRILGSDRDPSR